MPLVDPEALARTYNHPSKDPWEAVQLYREAAKRSDDWGSQRVASAINRDGSNDFEGISRAEVRAWVDGDSMPDAARAIEIGRDFGWFAEEWTPAVRALAKLVIGVFAFGAIKETGFVPSWSPDNDQSEAEIETALDSVGVGFQHVERDADFQGDEIRPAQHASPLGRALVVAGAPMSDKNANSVLGLPAWVDEAPMVVKMDLVVLLIRARAVSFEQKATRRIQTDRGKQYFRDVAELVEEVTGATATASDSGVTISADAVRELGLA